MHMETVPTIFAGAMVLYPSHRLLNFAVYACQKHEAKPPPGRFTTSSKITFATTIMFRSP